MNLVDLLEKVEDCNLTNEAKEAVSDYVGFTQGFHDLLVDFKIINSTGVVDVVTLEKSFEAILGELAAAALVLTSFEGVEADMLKIYENVKGREKVPEIVVEGYRRMAERVTRTRKSLDDE